MCLWLACGHEGSIGLTWRFVWCISGGNLLRLSQMDNLNSQNDNKIVERMRVYFRPGVRILLLRQVRRASTAIEQPPFTPPNPITSHAFEPAHTPPFPQDPRRLRRRASHPAAPPVRGGRAVEQDHHRLHRRRLAGRRQPRRLLGLADCRVVAVCDVDEAHLKRPSRRSTRNTATRTARATRISAN